MKWRTWEDERYHFDVIVGEMLSVFGETEAVVIEPQQADESRAVTQEDQTSEVRDITESSKGDSIELEIFLKHLQGSVAMVSHSITLLRTRRKNVSPWMRQSRVPKRRRSSEKMESRD
jgi:hypothetical protein